MKPSTAHRMESLAPHFFAALDAKITAMQAAGQDVIRLDIGAPDLPPPPPVIDALCRSAANSDKHSYQSHIGPPALRLAWAEMYRRVHGVDLDPLTEIVPLLGSKEGIFHLSLALIDPGDRVLIPDPGYITYTRGALLAGGAPFPLPLRPGRDFLPDLQAIPPEVARQAKILWLNYPNNPTGAIASLTFLAEAVEFARQYDILLCHDAAYAQVTFGGYRAPSILEIPGAKEVAIEFNSLSKSHNMAGWRVGAAVGNAQALRSLYTLKTNADSGHFLPVMEAAIAAMTGDQSWQAGRNEVYRQRRDLVITALHARGLPARSPQAGLYVWCPVPAGQTSVEFATRLLEQARGQPDPRHRLWGRGRRLRAHFLDNPGRTNCRSHAAHGRMEVNMPLRFLTAGESHGPALVAILEGVPAGLPLDEALLDRELSRRQAGYGAGPRMKLEHDTARLLGGVMEGVTTGAPLAIWIENRDHAKWRGQAIAPFTTPRPGHADLTGALKYGYRDLRPALERASARETAARVAVGAVCKHLLAQFGITVGGYVTAIGEVTARLESLSYPERITRAAESDVRCPDPEAAGAMHARIRRVMDEKDTLGGIIEVAALGLPPGLGSFAQWDRRLEARLGAAVLSIQAIKGVEIGPAFEIAHLPGTQAHDPIRLAGQELVRPTDRPAGWRAASPPASRWSSARR